MYLLYFFYFRLCSGTALVRGGRVQSRTRPSLWNPTARIAQVEYSFEYFLHNFHSTEINCKKNQRLEQGLNPYRLLSCQLYNHYTRMFCVVITHECPRINVLTVATHKCQNQTWRGEKTEVIENLENWNFGGYLLVIWNFSVCHFSIFS